MSKILRTAVRAGLLLSILLLAACSPAAPTPAPTPDLNALRTEVAATVLAQVPLICALTPTATLPPTVTPTQTPTENTPTVTLTVAAGTPGANTFDRARWVSQTVQDGARFAPGQTFSITWRVQNSGTTTWTPAYWVRWYSGNAFGAPTEIALDRDVPPGDFYDITVNMKAPTVIGEYSTTWTMSSPSRSNFKDAFFLSFVVANPTPTATQTVTPPESAVPTATPTP